MGWFGPTGDCGCCEGVGCEIWRVENVIATVTESGGFYPLPDLPESGWLIGVKVRTGETPVTGMTIEILDSADAVIAEIPVIDGVTTMQNTVVGSHTIPSGFGLEGFDPDSPGSYSAVFVARPSGVMAIGNAAVNESIANPGSLFIEMGSGWSVGNTTNNRSGFWLPALAGSGDRKIRLNPNGQNFGIDIFAFDLSDPSESEPECLDPHLCKFTNERSQPKWDRGTDNLLPSLSFIQRNYGFGASLNTINQVVVYPSDAEDTDYKVRATFPNNPSIDGAFISSGHEPPNIHSWRVLIDYQIDISNFSGATVDLNISLSIISLNDTGTIPRKIQKISSSAVPSGNVNEFEYTFTKPPGFAGSTLIFNWAKTISKWSGSSPDIVLDGGDAVSVVWHPSVFESPITLNAGERATGEIDFRGPLKIIFSEELDASPNYVFATNQLAYDVQYGPNAALVVPDDVVFNLIANTLVLPQPA